MPTPAVAVTASAAATTCEHAHHQTRRSKMRKLMLAGTVASAAVAMWVGSAEAAAPPATASCQGVLASQAAQYAPGTVAYLTHLLQQEAASAGVPMGSPQSRLRANEGRLRILNSPGLERRFVTRRAASARPEAEGRCGSKVLQRTIATPRSASSELNKKRRPHADHGAVDTNEEVPADRHIGRRSTEGVK